MSKEKLTVDNTIYAIQSKVFISDAGNYNPQKSARIYLINLIKQIRDELYKSLVESDAGFSETAFQKVFDKYIK